MDKVSFIGFSAMRTAAVGPLQKKVWTCAVAWLKGGVSSQSWR